MGEFNRCDQKTEKTEEYFNFMNFHHRFYLKLVPKRYRNTT